MTEQVILPGSFDEVIDVLHAADVFVLPSYEEGMSLSLLEAMAAKLPAVASDIPGNRKLIVNGEHGLLVPPRTTTELAEAIMRLIDDATLAAKLAAQARRRVEQEFSLRAMAERHLEICEKLIAARATH